MDRRAALTKLAAAGAVGATSTMLASSDAFAAMGSCCTASASYQLVASCNIVNYSPAPGNPCLPPVYTNTIPVCRTLPSTPMLLSRYANGTSRPYFDELAWIRVTSPLGVSRSRNFIGWEADCAPAATNGSSTGFNVGSTCGSSAGSAVSVSDLFGTTECGIFTVRIEVHNRYTPYGYSTAFIIPS